MKRAVSFNYCSGIDGRNKTTDFPREYSARGYLHLELLVALLLCRADLAGVDLRGKAERAKGR
jgi:hypothetical protein